MAKSKLSKSMPISFKPSYKTLIKNNMVEVRKYPPCKKTIHVLESFGLKSYFVPLPYQVYVALGDGEAYRDRHRLFFASFAAEDDKFVYPTPFCSLNAAICLDTNWHVYIPPKADLNEAISRFWSTYFENHLGRLENMLGVSSFKEWSKLTTDQVVSRQCYGSHFVQSWIDDINRIYVNPL